MAFIAMGSSKSYPKKDGWLSLRIEDGFHCNGIFKELPRTWLEESSVLQK